MKFHIEKIYLWFSPTEKNCLTFQNNKVNVVRGNSSRGKSNIFAIIDYCLMSDKPNIVEPVINECTEAYGMEFVLNDEYFAVSRIKPDAGTASEFVWMQNKPFDDDYYPNGTSNIKPNDLRHLLDLRFGLTEEYMYPWGREDDVPSLTVSFRSFLMFNALTENLIASQYEFLNYKFFEDAYVESREKRDYLFDVLLGIDNVEQRKQRRLIEELDSAQRSSKRKNTAYRNASQDYKKYRATMLQLCEKIEPGCLASLADKDGHALFEAIKSLVCKYAPQQDKEIKKADNEYSGLSTELYRKKLLMLNIRKAQQEYLKYQEELAGIDDSLKPVEYLKQHLPEYGSTIWSNHILHELETSLNKLKKKNPNEELAALISSNNIEQLEKEIGELEKKLQELSQIKLKPMEESGLYVALGQVKAMFPVLVEKYGKIPAVMPKDYDYVHDREIRTKAESVINEIESRRLSVVRSVLNGYFQQVYDSLSSMDNFKGCKTRYDRNHERLELSDGKSILNYANIGSQSNYMFLHLSFFLGLHNFLIDNPCKQIGQFLFVDQPSVPYYENKDDEKSNDMQKLLDAFRCLNSFMKHMVENGEEFQIILIEHADESYWTGENNLDYFTTRANFDGDEALVPYKILKQKRDED